MQPDPLAQLRDVHLPGQPGWWPPAPGWWLLALVLLGALSWLGWQLWRRQQQRRPYRLAQSLHQQLCADLAQQRISAENYLHEANALLKRAFVHALGEADAAALTGARWLSFLNDFVDGEPFTGSAGALLSESRFAPAGPTDTAALSALQQHIEAALQAAAKR